MKIAWEVEDGYVGKSRPQSTNVPDDEIAECETVDEAMDLIHEYIRYDFDQRIAHGMTDHDEVEAAVKHLVEGAAAHRAASGAASAGVIAATARSFGVPMMTDTL